MYTSIAMAMQMPLQQSEQVRNISHLWMSIFPILMPLQQSRRAFSIASSITWWCAKNNILEQGHTQVDMFKRGSTRRGINLRRPNS